MDKVKKAKEILILDDEISALLADKLDSIQESVDKLPTEIPEVSIPQPFDFTDQLNEILEQVKKNENFDIQITPELREKLKGDSYTLTDEDKKQIASLITVPVVEKVIERTEVVRETPIVTENIVERTTEVISGETLVDRINTQNKKIKKEKVEGLNELENIVKQNANVPKGIWQGISEVRAKELIHEFAPVSPAPDLTPYVKTSDLPTVVPANETDPLSLHLDQSGTPQSVINGTPSFYDIKYPRASLGTPTYSSQNDFNNSFGSAGRKTGGVLSVVGGGYIAVSAGTGFIKATDDDNAQLMFFDFPAPSNILIPSSSTKYIGVEYNAGTPRVVARDTFDWNMDTEFPLGRAISEPINGVDDIYVYNMPWWVTDGTTNIIQALSGFGDLRRDESVGGLMLSVTGTRNIAVSQGKVWARLNDYDFASLDTAVTGDVEAYWYSSTGGWQEADVTQYSVTQWNDVTQATLQTIDLNKYCNVWIYAELDGSDVHIALLYPQAQYNTSASAEAMQAPSNIPTHIANMGLLLGRIIIKQGVAAPVKVQTVFETTFSASLAADHGNLTGLSDDDHLQYLLATGTRTGASTQAQTFTNGVVAPKIYPLADSTTAFQINKADGVTNILNIDTTNDRIGIGTVSPQSSLHILRNDTTGQNVNLPQLFLDNPNTGAGTYAISRTKVGTGYAGGYAELWIQSSGAAVAANGLNTIRGVSNHDLVISTNDTERMRITKAGNVGIGATTPLSALQVGATGTSDVANVTSKSTLIGGQQNTTLETILRLERTVWGSNYYPATVDFKINAYQAGGAGVNYNPSTQLVISLKNAQSYNLGADVDVMYLTAAGKVGIGITPAQTFDVNGISLLRDKLAFTQTDLNEYIDSLADGYMDYAATTAHRFVIGSTTRASISNTRSYFDTYCWFGGTDTGIGYDSNWKSTFAGASSSYGYIARFRSVGTNDNAVFDISTANNSNGMKLGVGVDSGTKYAYFDHQSSGGQVRGLSNGNLATFISLGYWGNHTTDDSSGIKTQIHGDATAIYSDETVGDPTDNGSYVDTTSGSFIDQAINIKVWAYKATSDANTVYSATPADFSVSDYSSTYFQVQAQWNAATDAEGYVVSVSTDGGMSWSYYIDVGASTSTVIDGSYSGWTSGEFTPTYTSPYQIQTGTEYAASANFKGAIILAGQPEHSTETPVAGMVRYDSSDNHFYGYNGSAWVQLDNV